MANRVVVNENRPWFRHWPKSLPRSLDYPEVPMFEPAETSARRYPDKPVIIYYGREISYREFWDSVLKFATYLKKIGIIKGDRVMLHLPNSPLFVIACYGIWRANAVVVAADPMLSAEGLKELINDSGTRAAVTMASSLPRINAIRTATTLERVIAGEFADYLPPEPTLPVLPSMLAPRGSIPRDVTPWARVMRIALKPPQIQVGPDDLAVLMYTSGTTGERKGAAHTHRSMIANTLRPAYWNCKYPSSVHLSVLPFFHITGMHYGMSAVIYTGGTMVILSRWEREAAIQAIEKYRCTHWTNVMTMIVDMLAVPDIERRDLSSLIMFGGGGAAMPKAVGERLSAMGLSYMEGYGLTEAGSGTHKNPAERPKLQCLGIPGFDIDALVIDPESLEEMPVGKSGELILRSPSMMKEFWNKPVETARAFLTINGEQWLRTGDLVYMDDDGYFFMVDRLKRMVNRAGLKVWPAVIEGEYYKHPAVREACIIGTPDDRVGEEVKACIVLNQDYTGRITEEELKAWGKERFAAYEYPRIVEFVREMPKNAAGKILWRQLQLEEKHKKQTT
jgi:fatty-acyl-CoA synthase